ncbi:hypothetical protein H5410_031222 [Solanum commersonii]|uniref:DUF7746 domain-containing protein n=1 Tax=Solanum commersonii TaxID=4109 RepID=A0A9J5YL21_SOLCO|nr:hypothetical protein H5410_031222 [Solanum commersonii]
MHIGLVQVAFKPLTLRSLPESFIAALHDGRNYNWKKSLIGTIQTSLAYGSVYCNVYPNLQISLQDENSLSSLILNVKLHGYDYIPRTEDVCICYRIYYKLLHTLNPMCKMIDFKNETILIETNFGKSKVVTKRPIKWEEIDFPQEWVIESATQPRNNINTEISEIEQLNDGTVKIRFSDPISMHDSIDNRRMSSRMIRSNSSYISHIDYIVQAPSQKDFTLSNREITKSVFPPQQCFQINKNDKVVNFNTFSKLFKNNTTLVTTLHVNAMIKQNNYVNIYMSILGEHIISLHDTVDKLISLLPTKIKGKEKVAHSSLQPPPDIDDFKIKDYSDLEDFLAKEFKGGGLQPINARNLSKGEPSHKNEFSDDINNILENYARKPVQRIKEIYEWNIDGYTDRQIYTTVHRMLMYSTICKTNKNSDKTITYMITAGVKILQEIKQEGEQYIQNAVYTLVLNIIEHFSRRWSDNSETIRTLLQNLRCKTLTSFRVRKSLRGDNTSINYEEYAYGKLISACVQEGLSLCNEIKLNQQIKRQRLNERQQLGEFCEQFAFNVPKQKSKDKEYTPNKKKSSKKDYEKWKKKRIEKRLRRAEEGKGDSSKRKKKYRHNYKKSDTCHKCEIFGHYASRLEDNSSKESSTSEDLKALKQEDLYKTSEDECLPCQQGLKCEAEEDDLYKIYSQFKDLSLNVIDNDDVLDLLKNIKDPEVRAQIIDKISTALT